jgi:hypothetical protein
MGAQQPRLARKAAAGLVRLDPEALGKLVDFGLALIGHMAKLLGDFRFAHRRFPQFSRRLSQEVDRVPNGINHVFSHPVLPISQPPLRTGILPNVPFPNR